MQKLEVLQRKVKNAEDLQSIVRTMKVMSAVGIRQFEQAVDSLGDYFDTLEKGLQVVLANAFSEATPFLTSGDQEVTGVIVLGSGQSLCGPFDETILSYTLQHIRDEGITDKRFYVIGARLSEYMRQHQMNIDKTFEMPGTVNSINGLVFDLLSGIESWQEEQIRSVMVIHNKPVPKKGYRSRTQHLLPLNKTWLEHLVRQPWPTNNIPQFSLDSHTLFVKLLRQYLFVSLFRAVAESLAAEYSSRLTAMQRAERKIEERLDELNRMFTQERQTSITDELLDIMAGFESIQSHGD